MLAMAKRTTHVKKAANDNPQGRRPEVRAGRVRPTESVGSLGTAIYAGNIVGIEKDPRLNGVEKYRTFGEILANITIVAAGVRFFLNMVAKAKWKAQAPEDSGAKGEELAERVQKIMEGMETPWYRIVRKAAMFPFYGFAVLEWVAKRDEDGTIVFADIENRPQNTIERWDTDETGKVLAVLQRNPQTQIEYAIPREKIVYLVDDSLTDSPEGLGLFRHIVDACARLRRYEQLEGFGYEGDLRGVPLVRAPLTALREKVRAGTMSKTDMEALLAPLRDFVTNHVKNPNLGMLLDSETFRNKDAAASPSGVFQWMVELLEGGEYSLEEVARAIERVTMEIARVLGVEHLLLGSQSTGAGSYALSKDKSNNFGLTIDGTLRALREAFKKDLLGPLWLLNGWDPELMPELITDTNATRDLEQVSAVIRDLSAAGVVLDREDDAVGELFELLGLPRPKGPILTDPDAQLNSKEGAQASDDGMPEAPEDDDEEEDATDAEKAARREYKRAPAGTSAGGQFASTGGAGGGGQEPKTAAQALQAKVLDKGGSVRPGSFDAKGERIMEVTGDKGTVMVTVNRAGEIVTSDAPSVNASQKKNPNHIMRAAFKKP
jgi:hypothetical protein